MLEILISFVFATAILAVSPGPDNIFVLTQSIVNGKKYGMATVCGLLSGCIVHTSFLAFGISAIIKQEQHLFFLIKLFGAFYLLYLSYQVYKSDASITLSTKFVIKTTSLKLFKKGFLMNVLNPKVSIFFLAFFPQFLFSNSLSKVLQFYVLGGLFVLVSFLIFGTIVLLGSQVSEYLTKNKNVGIYLKWAQIVVFVSIAVLILI